jgi:hypothetical protein
MPIKLTDLTITKIALVPEGDNKGAECLIFKRKPEPEKPADESEENIFKRVLVALGKALGFDGPEPAGIERRAADEQKGEIEVKIDKSKLTPEELTALEAIEKKAGVTEDGAADVDKDKPDASKGEDGQELGGDGEDIYKGIHPVIKAELERLRKQADAAEERELAAIAKKYEVIGKKPEELIPILKGLKTAGGDTYDQMIAIMDASVEAFEKSGIFNEIGKAGGGETDALKQIDAHAAEILKAAPTLTLDQAKARAWEQHPELVDAYEQARG